jgi:hypothetical protein
VIENVKDIAGAGAHQRVIERGTKIDQHQRAGKDGAADNEPRRAARGGDNQANRSRNGERGADAVGDGVGQDVAQFLGGVHKTIIVRQSEGAMTRSGLLFRIRTRARHGNLRPGLPLRGVDRS